MTASTSPASLEPPGAGELLARVRRFLLEDVLIEVGDAKVKHRLRVAANLLELVEREIAEVPPGTDADGRMAPPALIDRYGSVAELTAALEAGTVSIVDPEVFAVLSEYTALKVGVAEIRRHPSH